MFKLMITLALSFLIGSSFLQVLRTIIKAWMSFNFAQLSLGTVELAAMERMDLQGRSVVATLAPSLFI